MEPTTLAISAIDVLEAENSRLRAVLETIRDMAGIMAIAAKSPTAQSGLAYLSGLAAEVLEES